MKQFVLLFLLLVNSSAFAFVPPQKKDGLAIATPAEVGLDPVQIERAFQRARKLSISHSLLVYKNDRLVAEEYFNGYRIDTPNNLHSISKSVISALVGIAIDQKKLKSLDEPVRNYFPEIFRNLKDPRKNKILLRHLLTMTAGLDANDDSPTFTPWPEFDETAYTLARPVLHEPGEVFSYATPYSSMVVRLLPQLTGMSTRDFAQKYLFDPMRAKILGWGRNAIGFHNSTIFLTSRDLLKFGVLYLNEGKFDGKRILSAGWVKESTGPKIKGSEDNGEYGYFWWSQPKADTPFFYAWGFGGQLVYVVPQKRIVVVMTNSSEKRKKEELSEIRGLIEGDVLGAAK